MFKEVVYTNDLCKLLPFFLYSWKLCPCWKGFYSCNGKKIILQKAKIRKKINHEEGERETNTWLIHQLHHLRLWGVGGISRSSIVCLSFGVNGTLRIRFNAMRWTLVFCLFFWYAHIPTPAPAMMTWPPKN